MNGLIGINLNDFFLNNFIEDEQTEQGSSSSNQNPILPISSNILNHGKTVSDRIKYNLDFAAKQQNAQREKVENEHEFILSEDTDIEKITIRVGNREITRVIREEQKRVGNFEVGIAHCQGRRISMEDETLATSLSLRIKNGKSYRVDIFAIFDGHGGKNAADYVKNNLVTYLENIFQEYDEEFLDDEGIYLIIKDCFRELQDDYPETKDGTTVTANFVIENKLWVANIGDARTALYSQGKAIQLTEDQKTDTPRYRKKIESRDGVIQQIILDKALFLEGGRYYGKTYTLHPTLTGMVLSGIYRVKNQLNQNGGLAMPRAIGDKFLKTAKGYLISGSPKITNYSLENIREFFLLVACDGLWDVCDTETAMKSVNQQLIVGESVGSCAKRMVHSAVKSGSDDNVSALVVKFTA